MSIRSPRRYHSPRAPSRKKRTGLRPGRREPRRTPGTSFRFSFQRARNRSASLIPHRSGRIPQASSSFPTAPLPFPPGNGARTPRRIAFPVRHLPRRPGNASFPPQTGSRQRGTPRASPPTSCTLEGMPHSPWGMSRERRGMGHSPEGKRHKSWGIRAAIHSESPNPASKAALRRIDNSSPRIHYMYIIVICPEASPRGAPQAEKGPGISTDRRTPPSHQASRPRSGGSPEVRPELFDN